MLWGSSPHPLLLLLLFLTPPLTWEDSFPSGPSVGTVTEAEPVIGRRGFSVVWNMPTARCRRHHGVSLPLRQYDLTHNPKQHFLGPNVSLFYQRRLGLYPYLTANGSKVNGGVPQWGNLKAHLSLAEGQIRFLMGRGFAGMAVLDWEAWRPLWKRDFGAKAVYRRLSKELVRRRRPDLSPQEVTLQARKEFEFAAQAFMSETLRLGTRLRPAGLWGFYSFPGCYNNHGMGKRYYTGQCHNGTRELNDQLGWLWQQSTALYPSVYVRPQLAGHKHAALMVRHRVMEALRVASQHATGVQALPVLPYARVAFTHTLRFLSQVDLEHTLGEIAALGAAGVVLWGEMSFAKSKHQCMLLRDYISSVLGPYVASLRLRVHCCSETLCSGNGRCARRDPLSGHMIPPVKHACDPGRNLRPEFQCVCYKGWGGEQCDERTTPGSSNGIDPDPGPQSVYQSVHDVAV